MFRQDRDFVYSGTRSWPRRAFTADVAILCAREATAETIEGSVLAQIPRRDESDTYESFLDGERSRSLPRKNQDANTIQPAL